jgi:hypothetical protein
MSRRSCGPATRLNVQPIAEVAEKDHIGTENRGILEVADAVPASEFIKNFGRYEIEAQREAVAVSSHGQIVGFFVAPHEYQELCRLNGMRRSFTTEDLSNEEFEAIASSRMDPRRDHLDKILDPK